MTCSKGRRPPFRRPRIEKRTRHDSNVRPQASQTCALIHLSYGFEGKPLAVSSKQFHPAHFLKPKANS